MRATSWPCGSATRIALAFALLAVSCAPRTPGFDRARVTYELRRPLADWVGYWRRYDPAFTLDSLRWGAPDSLRFEAAQVLPDSLRAVQEARWFAWSPDHTRAIDPNEYREWDPDRHEFGYDDVSASVLLDFSLHVSQVFDRSGMDQRNDDAKWLDRDRFVVTGWRSAVADSDLYQPLVTLVDLDRRTSVTAAGRAVRVGGEP